MGKSPDGEQFPQFHPAGVLNSLTLPMARRTQSHKQVVPVLPRLFSGNIGAVMDFQLERPFPAVMAFPIRQGNDLTAALMPLKRAELVRVIGHGNLSSRRILNSIRLRLPKGLQFRHVLAVLGDGEFLALPHLRKHFPGRTAKLHNRDPFMVPGQHFHV
jgi:hypothetical protein